MAKTWQNYVCTFETSNTSNTLPDSKYLVTAIEMLRVAFVNAGPGRPPAQIVNRVPSICFLDANSPLKTAIFRQRDDRQITIMAVVGDAIHVKVNGVPGGSHTIGAASRAPQNGLLTFDFTNNNGVLTHIHVGHAVKNVSPGVNPIDYQNAQQMLNTVLTQVNLKNLMLAQIQGRG